MEFYKKLGIQPLINASETYTNLGGSLMEPATIQAMKEAASSFVDFNELLDKVCLRAAKITNNEGAFITSGAAGGIILSAAACMCGNNEELINNLPNTKKIEKNEILIFNGNFLEMIPYWKLISISGAKIVPVDTTIDAMLSAINSKTAAVFLFPASLYETGIPRCEEIIPELKKRGITVVVDAAAQLPPQSNLWYYTKKLGADLAIFSGGKHIKGPQSTGLIVGRKDLTNACQVAASPNPNIGRAFKTGKEELAGFLTALENFVKEPEKVQYKRQEKMLLYMENELKKQVNIKTELVEQGRLGTYQPILKITLPNGKTSEQCNKFTRSYSTPIDVGVYSKEFGMPKNMIFLNAYNLKKDELNIIIEAICEFINQ